MADSSRIRDDLGWAARHSTVDEIIRAEWVARSSTAGLQSII